MDGWRAAKISVSPLLIPYYGTEWAFHQCCLPDLGYFGVIEIPGTDDPEDIRLHEYPLMVHEMAHDLIARNHKAFWQIYLPRIEAPLSEMLLSMGASKGSALEAEKELHKTIKEYWERNEGHSWGMN